MRINPKLIEEGYINVQKHPSYNYFIYNYSHKAQFDSKWDEDTMQCRGLILDGDGNVIARPFKKFFNLEQHTELPKYNSFDVFKKLDGSLGILYQSPLLKQSFIATRGSFVSEQAKFATGILHIKYSHIKFNPQFTYLFEIIYPENRIVVNYGSTRDIFLLAIIDNHTGKDLSWDYVKKFSEDNGLPLVEKYEGISEFEKLQKLNLTNEEGFVILFDTGLRIKVKFEDYKKLHRTIFNLSTKSIWECLKSGQKMEDFIMNLPDEFYKWALKEKAKLEGEYRAIETYCNYIVGLLPLTLRTKQYGSEIPMKEIALYFQECKYQSVLFAMHKFKSYDQIIWKLLEPEYKRPYGGTEEDS